MDQTGAPPARHTRTPKQFGNEGKTNVKETRGELVRIERHPDSPMIVVVAENGGRGLLLSENDRWAIAGAGPARDTWFPTWYAFDVAGPGLDFHGVPATLEAAVEARRHTHEREPSTRPCLPHAERTVPWWREQAARAEIEDPRFRGPASGRFSCLCAQLLDRDDGMPFPASCLRDAKPRLVAERGCRILKTEPWGEVWARGCERTATAIDRIIDEAPHATGIFRKAEIRRDVWDAIRPDVQATLRAELLPPETS